MERNNMSGMFESRKTNCEVEKESVANKKESVEEEYYSLEQVANKLGISITLLRNKLPEYNIKPKKISKILSVSREDFQNIKRQRIIAGVKKLSCIEDFELCEECMERILK